MNEISPVLITAESLTAKRADFLIDLLSRYRRQRELVDNLTGELNSARHTLDNSLSELRKYGIIASEPVPAVVPVLVPSPALPVAAPDVTVPDAAQKMHGESAPIIRVCQDCGEPGKRSLCYPCMTKRNQARHSKAPAPVTASVHTEDADETEPAQGNESSLPAPLTDSPGEGTNKPAFIPMPPTEIDAIMAHTPHRNMLMMARAKAIRSPEVIAEGACHLTWDWYESGIVRSWDIQHYVGDAVADGLIESLRRRGNDWISDATEQVVGRVQQ